MMNRESIITKNAPLAIGPYSQAIKVNNFIFVSGQLPINPTTGEIVAGSAKEQTKQVLENVKAVLNASGANLSNVVKSTVYIKNMDNFSEINNVYSEYFQPPYPARACVEVARLPKDVLVEIEVIATI